jgi:CheY-like chemotaxis protein
MATILVVEDDANIRKLTATYLKRDGYRILEAADGVAALDVMEHERIDLMGRYYDAENGRLHTHARPPRRAL